MQTVCQLCVIAYLLLVVADDQGFFMLLVYVVVSVFSASQNFSIEVSLCFIVGMHVHVHA